MHSEKNRGGKTELRRRVRVKDKAKEKKSTDWSKKNQEEQKGSLEKMVSWNQRGQRALERRKFRERKH